MKICVPTADESKVVEIEELPEEEDALDFLTTDMPPLKYWIKLAIAYYEAGQVPSFERIMRTAATEETDRFSNQNQTKEDRISLLNRLTAYYFQKAQLTTENSAKEDLFNQASSYIRLADRQDINSKANWVCRGFLLLAKAQLDSAAHYFNNTLDAQPDHILALLGKASILYHQEKYSESLTHYAQVIRLNPIVPPNVRLGLAVCHYKLGNKDLALKSLNRVLSLDSSNSTALMTMALLMKDKGAHEKYLHYLCEAYKADRTNTMANLHLARHYFYKEDYDRSMKLAEYCLDKIGDADKRTSEMARLKSECYYTIAQCYHVSNDFENAFRNYTQSVRLDSSFYLAQYGLGQMYLHQKDLAKALQCFESVNQQVPNNYETLRILGSLYSKQHKKELALSKLNQVVEINPDDAEAWIEIAQLLEISKPRKALESYEEALKRIENPPAELWNNIAILRHKINNQEGAQQAYSKVSDVKKTIIFNKARWHEDNCRFEEAQKLYEKLIVDQEDYCEAYLRLAILLKTQGNYTKALEHTRKAISYEKKPVNSLCQKGALEAELGEARKALETFNKVIMEHSHHDLYALIAMGNQYYEVALRSKDEDHFQQNLKRALQYYNKVISLDEHNAYAAVGISIVLAEWGDLNQAHETFKQVFDSNPSLDFVLANQAHLHMLQGRYDLSLKLYYKAAERSKMDKEVLSTYIATALFASGKYKESAEVLREMPVKAWNRYNLALALHEYGLSVFRKEKREVTETQDAIEKLKEAVEVYEEVINNKWEPRLGNEARVEEKKKIEWATKKAENKVEMAKGLLEDSAEYLEHDIKVHKEEENQRLKNKQKFMEILAQERNEVTPSKVMKHEES